ncbi:MAG TPA: glycosyltransferase family 4 protein [Steroidobacteraceae bacterium]|nr:glycosyltransferase family 4 protein [Steroidobacteraceae bacterium]
MWAALVSAAASLLVSACLTAAARRFALRRGMLDVPNARSSHQRATPRGGGIAIVITVSVMTLMLALAGMVARNFCVALLGGGVLVAAVGFVDDRRALPASVRFAAQTLATAWALWWIGGLTQLQMGGQVVHPGWPGALIAALGILWTMNLFNFMDGIDGLAAAEAVFVAGAGAVLAAVAGHGAIAAVAWVLAWASAGFLCWNWPPARIFMGDVGSSYLGYAIALLALGDVQSQPAAVWVWLILGGVFFVDATVTLVRRWLRRERVSQAHRQHAYQWLARRFGHRPVTIGVLLVDLLWLFPCALLASRQPPLATATVIGALLPLVVVALRAGAGRREVATLSGREGCP